MNREETRDYVKATYGAYIVEWRKRDVPPNKKSWFKLASVIVDLEKGKALGDRNPERLRKTIRIIFDELTANNDVSNESVTQEGPGYGENAMETDAFKRYCIEEGIDQSRVKSCKFVNHTGQQKFNIVLDYKDEAKEKTYMDYRDEIIKDMDKHSPKYIELRGVKKKEDGRLLVIGLADLHIGQLSYFSETHEVYNTEIAIKRTTEGVLELLNQAEGFNVSEVLIPIGGDTLNVDNVHGSTSNHTNQQSGSWFDAFVEARKMYVSLIENILHKGYKVTVQYIPGNHDLMSSAFLCDSISSYLRHTDVIFDIDVFHRKYKTFGANLIGIAHGHGVKLQKLSLLAANEAKDWSATKYRYVYTQHVHHSELRLLDDVGVTIQSLRTPVSSSNWASANGYQHALPSIMGFIHDKHQGQIAQLNYNF